MRQYIYYEGKTEYIINRKTAEQYPIGKLLFAFLDVDWYQLAKQTDAVREKISDNEGIPYFLVAAIYQQHRVVLQAFHPHLFRLVDAYMKEKIESVYQKDLPVAQAFALSLFRNYPKEPMSADQFNSFMYGSEPYVPDGPLVDIAVRFIDDITQLYHDLQHFSADLHDMVKFALDDTEGHNDLSARQRYYLMQVTEYAPFTNCIGLYDNVSIERRILDETELDCTHSREFTLELIQEIQKYELNAYTFYRSTDIRALVFLEFEYMCTNNFMIQRCEHCGRYFLPYSKVSLFCDRPVDDSGRTCKDVGAMEKYNQKVVADEASNLFRRLNNAYHMRTKRAPAVYTQATYEAWRDNARGLLKKVEEGTMTVEEFEERVHVNVKQN